MEDEDEHALEGVEDGEEVGHDDGALVDVHQTKGPGQAQQTQESDRPDHPRSEMGREKVTGSSSVSHDVCVCVCQEEKHQHSSG